MFVTNHCEYVKKVKHGFNSMRKPLPTPLWMCASFAKKNPSNLSSCGLFLLPILKGLFKRLLEEIKVDIKKKIDECFKESTKKQQLYKSIGITLKVIK